MRPTQVLLVGPSLDILGGQAVQAQRLLNQLERTRGVAVRFLPVNPRLPGPLRLLQRVRYLRTIVTTTAYLLTLIPAVWRADVVHAFSAGYWSFLLAPAPALMVSALFGRASILNYRTGEAEDHLRRHGWFAKPLMRLADRIVVPSGFLVDVFARHGLDAFAIANVVEPAATPYRRREPLGPRFLSNRNLEPLYNVGCILRAFAIVQARMPEATLVVAGTGSEAVKLRAEAEAQGLRGVTFVGAVAPSAMGALYDAADIYLNAPSVDNMPTSILEAFAAGLPIVSTRAGGIPYIVRDGENGLLVALDDHAAMAQASLLLLNNPSLAPRLTATARAEVEQRYTWTAVMPQWQELYASLASTRRVNA